ncbi:MAG: T9SS type A sorting domain-containing protein [candidate division Zixibacteria bacterium]|nr:T9SS type A sorting domain-containing protein [candidate division Zixibacteria bacterium]
MKKAIMLMVLLLCFSAAIHESAIAAPMHANQESALLQKCLQYQRVLTTRADCLPSQRTLLALTLAAAEVAPVDPAEYLQVYEQAGILVFYRRTSDTAFTWSGTEWANDHRTTYTYAGGSRVSDQISQTWSGTQWDNTSRLTFTYDGSSRLSTMTSQTWVSSAWANQTQSTYTYDGSGNAIELLTQQWQTSAWVNFAKTTMTYSGGRIATSTSQSWVSSAWVNASKTTFTYNVGGFLIETLMQNWQSSSWVNSMRFTSTFDLAGYETQSVTQMWSGSDWTNTYKNDYSYDGDDNEILDVRSMWAGSLWMATDADTSKYTTGTLVEEVSYGILTNMLHSTQYTYDASANLIEDITKSSPVGGDWTNESRDVYVYESYLDVTEMAASKIPDGFEVQNYPNPFNAGTVITYSLKKDAHVRVAICNVLGQTVATVVDADQTLGVHRVVWNGLDDRGGQVASGIYLFRVQAGEASQVRKMVLLR